MARLCYDIALENNNPAPFFIMQKVFSGIADYWEKGPVEVEQAQLVQAELDKPIRNLIYAIENETSAEIIIASMNAIVSSYNFLFSSS
jgi:hypothetical protein